MRDEIVSVRLASLEGYFRKRYPEVVSSGRDWLRRIPEDDRRAFARIGFAAAGYGRAGGLARARNARRDEQGKFR